MKNPLVRHVCFVGQMRYMHHRKKLSGVMQYANQHHECALQHFDYTQIPHKLCQTLLASMQLDGVIFGDGTAYSSFADYRRRVRIPTVVIDPLTFDFVPGDHPNITIELNHTEISNRIAAYFLKRKFIHFAYIGYDSNTWIPLDRISQRSELREKAFAKSIALHKHDCEILNISGRLDSAEKEKVRSWLTRLPKPCAIMAFWDNLARDVTDIATRSGISIPGQIAIMGTDNDLQMCESAAPTLTTIELDFEYAGRTAASELMRIINAPSAPDQAKHLQYGTRDIIERASTRDVSGASRIVSAACEYINPKATDGSLRLNDIAEHIHVSPRILQMRFAEVLGHSVVDEISKVKLAAVKDLLATTDLPIADIAMRCGYTAHHLVNFFKQKFGCSMSAWRSCQRTRWGQPTL